MKNIKHKNFAIGKLVIIILIFCSCFSSCDIDDVPFYHGMLRSPSNFNNLLLEQISDDHNLVISIDNFSYNDSLQITSQCVITILLNLGDGNNKINCGVLSVGNLEIPFDTSDTENNNGKPYYFSYNYNAIEEPDPDSLIEFGKVYNIKLGENIKYDVKAFDEDLYFPKEIMLEKPNRLDTVNLDEGLELEWNADTNNLYTVIYIHSYYSENKNRVKGNSYDDAWWFRKVPDKGSYTVPADLLQRFKNYKYLHIDIGRAREKVLEVSDKNYYIYALSKNSNKIVIKK